MSPQPLPPDIAARIVELQSAERELALKPECVDARREQNGCEIALRITILRHLPGAIGDAYRAREAAKAA